MFDLQLETAKVVDIDDKDKSGKIQINIESKFKNFKKDLLPWAIPLISDTSDSTMDFNPPKVGSQIWVLVDKYYKRFYYLSNRYFYNLFDFSKVSGLLDKCDKINKEYKNLRFSYFADGSVIFHNNEDGSSGIINSQGTLIYIDKEGSLIKKISNDENSSINGNKIENISGNQTSSIDGNCEYTIKGKDLKKVTSNIDYTTKGSVKLKSESINLIEFGNSVDTLGGVLQKLCNYLLSLTTTGSQSFHTASPTFIAQINSLLSEIKLIFK